MPKEKSINGGELNPAIITQDDEFNKFLMTLPENQRQTPESKYYTYKMWRIAGKPKDFNQAVDMGLYHWNDNDKSYHGNSVIYDKESDVYHFLKPKDHSTVQYELDWYNKGVTTDGNGNQYELAGDSKVEWEDFRRNYYLDSSGDDYAYRRRPTLGIPDKARNGIMATLENGVKAALQNKLSSINQSLQESRVNKFNGGGNTNTSNNDKNAYRSSVRDSLISEEPKTQRDNTRAYQVSDNAFVPRDVPMRDDILLSDGITGFIPFVGDALQLADAVNDVNNQNYGRAALTAGLMLVPNIIEKPVKAIAKPLKRFITHGIDSDVFMQSMRNWKGSPMPSMAVNDMDLPVYDFGNMTFIGSDDILDNSIIFKGDGLTPTVSTVGGDNIDDVQEVMRRMKAQQNTDEYNIGEIISKEDASTLPISGEGLEKYFEAKYQDFMSWDQFKHLVTYGKLDPDLLKLIEELKIPHTNVSKEEYINTIKRIATEEGLLFKDGGNLNIFAEGGDKNNAEAEIWKRKYKDLPEGFKQAVVKLAEDLNYNSKDAEQLFDSGALRTALDAKYTHAESSRVRDNDSPTSEASSSLEEGMNSSIYNNQSKKVLPNMKYAIPYIEDLEVVIPGVGRTTTNALDTLAKYAFEAQIPLEEALGLGAQETALGAIPFGNYKNVPKDATEEERKKILEYNRALGNSSYFRNYGIIPAENMVRDFRYNISEDPISRDTPPLVHAFNYWKDGYYNRGDSNHTEDVRRKGREVMNTEVIQEWIKNSKFAQKVINLFK